MGAKAATARLGRKPALESKLEGIRHVAVGHLEFDIAHALIPGGEDPNGSIERRLNS